MRLDVPQDQENNIAAELTLSERNLRALLHKLEMPNSARTIYAQTAHGRLIVHVETTEEHYANREAPGIMHPATEHAIARANDEG